MIKFLLQGIMNDRSRSLLPVIVVAIGVMLTVVLSCWLKGIMGDVVELSANYTAGHVKVMTRAYAENVDQKPNDLAILGASDLKADLANQFPDVEWAERISFGGLIDVPDENGNTREQGPAAGMSLDLLSPDSKEVERMNIKKSVVTGAMPSKPGEALMSDDFAKKLNLTAGETFTLFGSTMEGSMSFKNFKLSGTVRFGSAALDRGAVIIDINDAREALDMEDAAAEIFGFFNTGKYDNALADKMVASFNAKYATSTDEFDPTMQTLKDQGNLRTMIDQSDQMSGIMVFIFVVAMSIVLWNTGLLGALRRYSEFGVRLALGEPKGHIYKTIIYEAILIGVIGSVLGTIIGLAIAYPLQEIGVDFSSMLKNVSMMVPSVYKAKITPETFYIGFIPGLFSMVLGSALAGRGIYKRKTAQLFKELEV